MIAFARLKRQFNYLSKRINRLLDSQTWTTLSQTQRRQHIQRLKRLHQRIQYLIPTPIRLKTLGAAAILLTSSTFAQGQITFAAPQSNPFSLANNGNVVACVLADIDADGDLDLFQGHYDGSTRYNPNQGTNTTPSFGSTVNNPFNIVDVGDLNAPSFVDIDNDGDLDLFMGEGSNLPDLRYFQNTGTNTNPVFANATLNPFNFTPANFNRDITFADIDNDGDMDLFAGELYGNLHFYQNTGTASAPNFSTHVVNPFGITDIGNMLNPAFSDIDNDGDLDLFCGEYNGSIRYFENTGTATAPAFGAFQTNPFNITIPANSFVPSPTLADLDNDGDDDLLVSFFNGAVLYYENITISSVTNLDKTLNLTVSPNPTTDALFFAYELESTVDADQLELVISNVLGKTLSQHSLVSTSNSFELSTQDLPNGTYLYTIKTAKGQLTTGKFVVLK